MIYARVYTPSETLIFTNIVDNDIGYYDDRFFSRIGYADFSITFAYDPTPNSSLPTPNFSQWWQSLNKNAMPPIYVDLVSGNDVMASGRLTEWTEDRDACELEWTCIDETGLKLNAPVEDTSQSFFPSIYSPHIAALEQPPGPGNPPGGDDTPPIFPPGTPFITYAPQLREFFWAAINQWWNAHRGDCPPLTRPYPFPYELFQMDSLVRHINAYLQTRSNLTFRVAITFKNIDNLSCKEALSYLSKLTQSKIICKDGIHFFSSTAPTTITGYITSINNAPAINDIDDDKIIESVMLQNPIYSGDDISFWINYKDFTGDILKIRNDRLQTQMMPRTEYHIWGYAPTPLTSGDRITLDGQSYTIKDISYEPETMHTIRSFEAVCVLN